MNPSGLCLYTSILDDFRLGILLVRVGLEGNGRMVSSFIKNLKTSCRGLNGPQEERTRWAFNLNYISVGIA
jgi:hypothetical protein